MLLDENLNLGESEFCDAMAALNSDRCATTVSPMPVQCGRRGGGIVLRETVNV